MIEEHDEAVVSLIVRVSYTKPPRKLDLDLKNSEIPHAKLSIVEPLQLEIKSLPLHL